MAFARRSPYDAFAVVNACRVLHSLLTREVVRSKFGSAAWALAHLPVEHHGVLRAALATYRGQATRDDAATLAGERGSFFDYVDRSLPR